MLGGFLEKQKFSFYLWYHTPLHSKATGSSQHREGTDLSYAWAGIHAVNV